MTDIPMQESSSGHSDSTNEAIRFALLERRVDDLDESRRKWYTNPSILISFVALLASILGFGYSLYRDKLKDRDEKVIELQSSIMQLHTLTNQWIESYEKYKDSPDYPTIVVPAIRAEIALVGTKAYTLLDGLGNEGSSLDSATIANALEQAENYSTANKALLSGLEKAKNPAEYQVVSRMLGQLGYYRKNLDDGDKYFGLAEQAFEIFPLAGVNENEAGYAKAETEAYWAVAAASQKACDSAKAHVQRAKQYMAAIGFDQTAPNSITPMVDSIRTTCPDV